MSKLFLHGYALLVAVDENQIPGYALPAVARDATALRDVLVDPARCAYPPEQVRLLRGRGATADGIRQGLAWLAQQVAADRSGNATAVFYYTGHGARNAADNSYYLLPYDLASPLMDRVLRATDVAAHIEAMRPRRMLTLLDCCHAGGMGLKGTDLFSTLGLVKSAPPEGSRGLGVLAQGEGRAVLSSSSAAESSYLRRDRTMSIFTYHLVEALTGHAQPIDGSSEVLVSDVISYVSRAVPKSAHDEYGLSQTPVFQMSGENFPVALLLGGKGLRAGQQPPVPAPPRSEPAAPTTVNTAGGLANLGTIAVSGDFAGRDLYAGAKGNGKRQVQGGRASQTTQLLAEAKLAGAIDRVAAASLGNARDRGELTELIVALQTELEALPPSRRADVDRVLLRLEQVTAEIEAGDYDLLDVTGRALWRAAAALEGVRSGIPAIAGQIVGALHRLAQQAMPA